MQSLATKIQDVLIRVSVGSATVLGLTTGTLDTPPTTAYMLTYHPGRCSANCLFCSQAKNSQSRGDLLSRVNWPTFNLGAVLDAIAKEDRHIERVCIQAVNYPGVIEDVMTIASLILSRRQIHVSVSCQPMDSEALHSFHSIGVERIGIPVDAATPNLFDRLKGHGAGGPYSWERHMDALHQAVSTFGVDKVTTHLIVGLGETDREAMEFIQEMVDSGVFPALFAFTPIPGTQLEDRDPPPIRRYRLIQTARYAVVNRLIRLEDMRFDASGSIVDIGVPTEELKRIIRSGLPYLTSGCPGCNRPYYNERPSGPLYNFPRPLKQNEIEEIERIVKESLP